MKFLDYNKAEKYVYVTDDKDKMVEIGKAIVNEYKKLYNPLMIRRMLEAIEHHNPGVGEEEKELMLYRSIYDYWVYGCNVDEEYYLHFDKKTDAEKKEYLVNRLRHIYIHYLNNEGAVDVQHAVSLLEDKYKLYKRLKPYFKREMILIKNESDYPAFEEFARKHPEYVVKPFDYSFGIGVHKDSLKDFKNDPKAAFESLMEECRAFKRIHPQRQARMVLEEVIVQDESLAAFHKESVNAIRATAVKGKDGKIHIFHPWIKVGVNGTFVASAALDGFDAEIDPKTGIVITDGYQENGSKYEVHPNSGIKIKGFQIPKWDEMVEFVNEIMGKLPGFRYVGWDLVLTPDGWCVMEGNYSGEFTFQLINQRGYKKEFEKLIGWKYNKQYWWQDFYAHF